MKKASKQIKKFRGWFIRTEIIELLCLNEINSTEVNLLATIDSLASTENGCFASNQYLSEKLGVSEDHIKRMLRKLKQLKLIFQVEFDGRVRTMETVWSRVKSMGESNEGEDEGVVKMSPSDVVNNTGNHFRGGKNVAAAVVNHTTAAVVDLPPRLITFGNKYINKYMGRGLKTPPTPTPELLESAFTEEGAKRLMALLIKHEADLVQSPRRVKLSTLAKNFKILLFDRNISKQRIKKVIRWLTDHYSDTYTPKIRKADDFARNFKRYEEAIQRSEEFGQSSRENIGAREWDKALLVSRVISELDNRDILPPWKQSDIDDVLIRLGKTPGLLVNDDL